MERTEWRCQELSSRHREWGFNCPGVDLDFVMAEYNKGKPVAIIEYKHCLAREPQITHPTYRALEDLANNYASGPLPFMVVFYDPDTWIMRIIPVNQTAKNFYKGYLNLSEQEYVRSLYKMRNIVLQDADREALAKLNTTCPRQQPVA
jgi:hypothetical protein